MIMNDDELRQAMSALDNYQEQLEAITRQVRLLQASRDETVRAQRTFQALAAAKPGDEILVPVGASSFVNVLVTDHQKAVVGIGNKVSVEKSLADASQFMDTTGQEIAEALNKAIAAMQEVQEYTQELAAAVQDEYQARKQGAAPQ